MQIKALLLFKDRSDSKGKRVVITSSSGTLSVSSEQKYHDNQVYEQQIIYNTDNDGTYCIVYRGHDVSAFRTKAYTQQLAEQPLHLVMP